jgi:hypothetical protein
MQTTPTTKPHRDIVRPALGAALIAFLMPLLPLYGDSSGLFIFSQGLPLRFLPRSFSCGGPTSWW